MSSLRFRMFSPLPVYLDEKAAGASLAPRPANLEGKVVGLLPNWRPAAVHLLKTIGALLEEKCRVKSVVMEPPVHVAPMTKGGKLLDGMRDQLDDLARRADVVIVASGD